MCSVLCQVGAGRNLERTITAWWQTQKRIRGPSQDLAKGFPENKVVRKYRPNN